MREKQKQMRKLLECPEWPNGLEANTVYQRLHDDHDGTMEGVLKVIIGHDGDAWVATDPEGGRHGMRFRTLHGGGGSLRTRNALLLLAWAMKLDAEEGR